MQPIRFGVNVIILLETLATKLKYSTVEYGNANTIVMQLSTKISNDVL